MKYTEYIIIIILLYEADEQKQFGIYNKLPYSHSMTRNTRHLQYCTYIIVVIPNFLIFCAAIYKLQLIINLLQ